MTVNTGERRWNILPVLTERLTSCRKLKTKRLFLALQTNTISLGTSISMLQDFDLGKGDHALIKGGKIHPRYRIIAPKGFVPEENADGA